MGAGRHQVRHGGFVATGLSALRVRPQRPFQVIQIVNHEVNTDILIQISARHGQSSGHPPIPL
jgi:hypothetical protein